VETDLIKPLSFKRHRYPGEVIRYAVWLYFRFTLSLRDVEELLARHIQTIVLNVYESNEAAFRIYQRMGFKEHCRYLEVLAERRAR